MWWQICACWPLCSSTVVDGKVRWLPQLFMREARALFIHLASLFSIFFSFFFFYLSPSSSSVFSTNMCNIRYSHDWFADILSDSQRGRNLKLHRTLTCTHIGMQTHLCACWWLLPWWTGSSPPGHFLFGCHGYSLSSVRQGAAPKPVRKTCIQTHKWNKHCLSFVKNIVLLYCICTPNWVYWYDNIISSYS